MLTLGTTGRIWLCAQPVDGRKGFDGLCAVVTAHLGQDPLSGDLFVFRNRKGERLKILYWDRDGLAVWYKRLEQGTFQLPTPQTDSLAGQEITTADLAMLLEGVDLSTAQRRQRYQRPGQTR